MTFPRMVCVRCHIDVANSPTFKCRHLHRCLQREVAKYEWLNEAVEDVRSALVGGPDQDQTTKEYADDLASIRDDLRKALVHHIECHGTILEMEDAAYCHASAFGPFERPSGGQVVEGYVPDHVKETD